MACVLAQDLKLDGAVQNLRVSAAVELAADVDLLYSVSIPRPTIRPSVSDGVFLRG